jgi:hypothetical protein
VLASTRPHAYRFSNLPCMPPTPLPEGLAWPGKSGAPSPGLVPSILAYIQLINTRLPLLEYRGCHGIARICYAAPYGATPEVSDGRTAKEAKRSCYRLGHVANPCRFAWTEGSGQVSTWVWRRIDVAHAVAGVLALHWTVTRSLILYPTCKFPDPISPIFTHSPFFILIRLTSAA